MHIPDGYLSPATCAALYGASAPFWVVASRKMGRLLHTKLVPQLALFAAFSFVVMMFNLPLPGGTTGHAVGIGVAMAVLGPWGAVIAISTALAIQALFFGDGGILALGANCFNMAIVGPFVAWGLYRLMSGRAPLDSKKRVVTSAVAAYCGLNVAALFAAVEFGIQPELFKDAAGHPLYAPYPLGIAIPAMLLPHLAVAGLAEAFFTAGLVGWLQQLDPEWLRRGAGEITDGRQENRATKSFKPVWAVLVLAICLTPLGLLASGTAWGEWSAEDFKNPETRQEIKTGSMGQEPPAGVPSGLERHSESWKAPLPDYAPGFVRNESLGYVLSAALGTLVITGLFWGTGAMAKRRNLAG